MYWIDGSTQVKRTLTTITTAITVLVIRILLNCIPLQPYNSILKPMSPFQVNGRKRMKRAMIGGNISLNTTVSRSVFPVKT